MKETFYKIVAVGDSSKGHILMTGYIYPWENDCASFRSDFKNMEQSFDEIDITMMNLFGGSIIEGIPTYNLIKNSKSKTNTIVEGLVASMGSILAMAGNNKRAIAKYSRHMIHRAQSAILGDFEDLADGSQVCKDFQTDMVDIILANSNLEKGWIEKNLMVRGKDTYLTAQKCLEYGIATEIIESTITEDVPKAMLGKKANVQNVLKFYSKQLPNINNLLITDKTPLKMEKVIAKLGLAKDATEDEVLAAVAKLEKSEVKEDTSVVASLQDEIKQMKLDAATKATKDLDDKADVLVSAAIEAKKILPAQKDSYKKLAVADYDNTKAALDAMKGFTSIKDSLGNGGAGGEASLDSKDWDDLHKNHSKYLADMKETNPDLYKAKYEAKFGKK